MMKLDFSIFRESLLQISQLDRSFLARANKCNTLAQHHITYIVGWMLRNPWVSEDHDCAQQCWAMLCEHVAFMAFSSDNCQ